MWIRSQDKMGLFKAIGFKIREHGFEDGTKEFIILSNDNLYNVLGTYKSKERAIEVLDEIQNKIQSLNDDFYYKEELDTDFKIYKGYKKQHKDNVYQMPKE